MVLTSEEGPSLHRSMVVHGDRQQRAGKATRTSGVLQFLPVEVQGGQARMGVPVVSPARWAADSLFTA